MGKVYSSIVRGTVFITASRILTRVISFVSLFLVTSALSRQDYGMVVLALTISGPVLVIGGLGQDDTIMSYGARMIGEKKEEEATCVFKGYVIVKLGVSVLAILFLAFVKTLLGQKYAVILDQFLLPLQLWIILTVISTLADSVLQMRENFFWYAATDVCESLVKFFTVCLLYFTHTLSVSTILWAYVFGKIASILCAFPSFKYLFPKKQHIVVSIRAFANVVRTRGKWEVVRAGVGQLFSNTDVWFMSAILGLESVAIYSMASTMNSVLTSLLPFRQVVFPVLSRMSADHHAGSIVAKRMAKYSIWLNILLISISVIIVPPVVHIFYAKYVSAIPVFFFISLTLLLNAISTSHGPMLFAYGEQKFLLMLSAISTVMGLTVFPVLTLALGLYGAVFEHHLSTGITVWLRERHLRKKHHMTTFLWRDAFVFDTFDRELIKRVYTSIRSHIRFI